MVRSRSLRFLLAWLVLVTGLVGTARGARGPDCRRQGQVAPVDGLPPVAAVALDDVALDDVASRRGTLAVMPSRDWRETVPPAPAALAGVCTSAPAPPGRAAQLAPATPAVLEAAPWRPRQHASFVPPPLFRPPRPS